MATPRRVDFDKRWVVLSGGFAVGGWLAVEGGTAIGPWAAGILWFVAWVMVCYGFGAFDGGH